MHRNREQFTAGGSNALDRSDGGNYLFIDSRFEKRFKEIKRTTLSSAVVWLFYLVGLPAYAITVILDLLNMIDLSPWQRGTMWLIGVLFVLARLIVYCVENYQKYLWRKKKLKE